MQRLTTSIHREVDEEIERRWYFLRLLFNTLMMFKMEMNTAETCRNHGMSNEYMGLLMAADEIRQTTVSGFPLDFNSAYQALWNVHVDTQKAMKAVYDDKATDDIRNHIHDQGMRRAYSLRTGGNDSFDKTFFAAGFHALTSYYICVLKLQTIQNYQLWDCYAVPRYSHVSYHINANGTTAIVQLEDEIERMIKVASRIPLDLRDQCNRAIENTSHFIDMHENEVDVNNREQLNKYFDRLRAVNEYVRHLGAVRRMLAQQQIQNASTVN